MPVVSPGSDSNEWNIGAARERSSPRSWSQIRPLVGGDKPGSEYVAVRAPWSFATGTAGLDGGHLGALPRGFAEAVGKQGSLGTSSTRQLRRRHEAEPCRVIPAA